jgi:hypothetical protein
MTRHISAQLRPLTAHEWLAEAYPHRDRLRGEIARRVARCAAITANPPDKSFLGLAFEHALGLDLAVQPPYRPLLECLDEVQARRLLRLAGYHPPSADPTAVLPEWRNLPSSTCPARLFTAAASLAHLHQFVHQHGRSSPGTLAAGLRVPLRHVEVIHQIHRDMWATRPAFRAYWTSYTASARTALRSYGQVVAAPALLGGHRHADLIAGNTVVEIKTGRLDLPDYINQLIDQLLTYGLLALHDLQPTTHIAAYLARYELLIRYPIPDLLNELAGAPVHTPAAATRLATVIRASEPPVAWPGEPIPAT